MDSRYKIILSSNNIYQEIELAPDAWKLKVGTGVDCDVRLPKELFFGPIDLRFVKGEAEWAVYGSDELYLTVGDIRKLMTKTLAHGDVLQVKYQESDNVAFVLEFLIDFDNGTRYERMIDVAGAAGLVLGTEPGCTLVLSSPYVQGDSVRLKRQGSGYMLDIKYSHYGVYINGKRASSKDTIKDGDFWSISDYFFYFKAGCLWTQIRSDMRINGLTYLDRPNRNDYPRFHRNTRKKTVVCDEKIEVLDPPSKPQKPKGSLLTRLLPSVGMLLTAAVMAFMGGAMIIMSVISGALAILTTVLGIYEAKKDFKVSSAARIEKYNAYIERKKQEIEACRIQEAAQLEEVYISQEEVLRRFDAFSTDLFDRVPADEDFLCVRLGSGDVVSRREIEYRKQEKLEIEDDLQEMPAWLSETYRCVYNAPIVCGLKQMNAMGVVGSQAQRFVFLKNIVADLVARHYFTDVKMVFVANREHRDKIVWLRMLPHVYNEITQGRNIVCDDEGKNLVFEYLYKELTIREQQKKAAPHIVVFFYDEYGFQGHPISRFVDKAQELGVTFLFFGDTVAAIPQGCGGMVEIQDQQNAVLINTANKGETSAFTYPTLPNEQAQRLVQLLAPVYTEEISLEGTLTKNYSMYEMLNILAADDLNLDRQWSQSQVYKSMAAPIGVSKSGPVYLDLHDKAHGPHGLVAGTTGSGKSEILQTYILSMATLFHPYEVGFLIIDFKGGGMVNQFRALPHLLGAITNIDGKEIDRSLKSIKAELQKRQRLFAEVDVNHIDKYIQKFKAGEAKTPIPHLVLIVDEFAELKAEQPDFMKELISAARIGRSLGVHLILATQKPSGQVDDQIWSNSRFKLCLKVQSQEDSNEVLKSPLAAEIKEPGRAYLQVGNNEIFELFQSAYSGAPAKVLDSNVKEFTLYSVNEAGRRTPIYARKKRKSTESNETQLDAMVAFVHDHCAERDIHRLGSICLPSLAERIEFPETVQRTGGLVNIGVYDDPDNQFQGPAAIDIDHRHTFITGSSQYGKTNLLQGVIRTIASTASPAEANIYIVDFGSMVLKNFEDLHHVGGVVCSSEDEKLKNLFKLLFGEITSRKERLVSVGVSSFASYVEAGYRDIPQMYLFIDNLTALIELYLEEDDSLLTILREGVSVGLSVVVSNAQTAGIGYRYMTNFANKIALFSNDNSEYNNLFDHVDLTPDAKPGRCVLELDKRMLECQTYLSFTGEKEIDRVAQMQRFIQTVNSRCETQRARIIPFIPALLEADAFQRDFGAAASGYKMPLGLTYLDVVPFSLNLAKLGMLGVCGKENTGHKNFVANVLEHLNSVRGTCPARVAIFDDVTRKYSAYQKLDIVDTYTLNIEQVGELINSWHAELARRYDALMEEGAGEAANELLLLIIQNNDVAKKIGDDMDLSEKFTEMVNRYKDMNVAVIFANYPNASVSYDAPEPLRMVKQAQHLLFFEDLDNLKPFDVPYEELRANKKKVTTGDAYYIQDNSVTKLKVVRAAIW